MRGFTPLHVSFPVNPDSQAALYEPIEVAWERSIFPDPTACPLGLLTVTLISPTLCSKAHDPLPTEVNPKTCGSLLPAVVKLSRVSFVTQLLLLPGPPPTTSTFIPAPTEYTTVASCLLPVTRPAGFPAPPPAANSRMIRAPRGIGLRPISVKRNWEPPRRNDAPVMLNRVREADGIACTPTSLKFVSVSATVTTRRPVRPAIPTVAPQKSPVPTHRTR